MNRTSLLLAGLLAAGMTFANAAAQEADDGSQLAGFKSASDLINGAMEEPSEDDVFDNPFGDGDDWLVDGLFDDDFGDEDDDDAFFTEADLRADYLIAGEGWDCAAMPQDGGAPTPTFMTVTPKADGNLLITEVNFLEISSQTARITIEYDAVAVTDDADTVVTVGTTASRLTKAENLPDGVDIGDPGPIELKFQVVESENFLDDYMIKGFSIMGDAVSDLACEVGSGGA